MNKDQVDGIIVTLKADDEIVLHVLLDKDGSINRIGDGVLGSDDRDMYSGVAEEPLFERLRDEIDETLLEHDGIYELPDKVGIPLELTFIFKDGDDQTASLQFKYGAESQGLPLEVLNFLRAAEGTTSAWHADQKQSLVSVESSQNKPWWKFWR